MAQRSSFVSRSVFPGVTCCVDEMFGDTVGNGATVGGMIAVGASEKLCGAGEGKFP